MLAFAAILGGRLYGNGFIYMANMVIEWGIRVLSKGAMFVLLQMLIDLARDWDNLSGVMKAARVAVVVLAGAIYLMATTDMVSWINYMWMMRDALMASFGNTIMGPILSNIKSLAGSIGSIASTVGGGVLSGIKNFGAALVSFGAAIGSGLIGLFAALGGAIWGAVTATWAFTVALLANPITWVVLAVVGLIAGIVALIRNWDTVVAVMKKVGAVLGNFFSTVKEYAGKLVDILVAPFKAAYGKIKEALGSVWDFLFGEENEPKDIKVSGTVKYDGNQGQGQVKRAAGGPVYAGKSYWVGENGPETFIPNMAGMIVPNGRGGGNVQNFNISMNIDARGAGNPNDVAKAVENRLRSSLPDMVRNWSFSAV